VTIALVVIWLIFAGLFFWLGFRHWKQSNRFLPAFKVKPRPFQQPGSCITGTVDFLGSGLDKPLEDFVDDFNKYIDDQNRSNRDANRLAAYGYFLASGTAIISMLAELVKLLSSLK
jgi:hypothetical protein